MTCPNCYKLVAENAELSREAMALAVELRDLKDAVADLLGMVPTECHASPPTS